MVSVDFKSLVCDPCGVIGKVSAIEILKSQVENYSATTQYLVENDRGGPYLSYYFTAMYGSGWGFILNTSMPPKTCYVLYKQASAEKISI